MTTDGNRETSDTLVRVKATTRTLARAQTAHLAAILDAHAHGHPLRVIANQAGMSHESVRQLLNRTKETR